MNLLMGGPILWDGSGANSWDCLYYDWHHFQTIPEGAEKFDFRSHTSLDVRVEEPQRQYRLRYDQPDFKLDLEWKGIEPPHHFLGMEIEATGMSAENRMHLEQMGRGTGWLELRGERMQVDCYALRDSSWGVRQMDGVKRGSYFWAIHDDDNAFHAQVMGEGDEMRVVGGFLKLDGVTASLCGGNRLVTEMGEVTPHLFDLRLEDTTGRTLDVKARSCSDLMVNFYPRVQVVWSLLEADFDIGGEPIVARVNDAIPPGTQQFTVQAITAKAVTLRINGGLLPSGGDTVNLAPGQTITITNQTAGTTYNVRLLGIKKAS